MPTAFDSIMTGRQLQDHWLRRLIAGIIDSIIISIASWIISVIVAIPALIVGGAGSFIIGGFSFLNGVLFFLYAALMETTTGATIGKQIMNLKVTTMEGNKPRFDRALIRNISKIHGLLWFLDTIIGMATVGDTHQKYSDRFARTTVASTITRNLLIPSSTYAQAEPTPPSEPSP